MVEETIEQKLKNYQVLCNWQQDKIALLEKRIKENESIQAAKCCECERGTVQEYSDLMCKLQPFQDDYFKSLNYENIAALAKKSIKITAENSDLEHKLETIYILLTQAEDQGKARKAIIEMIKKAINIEEI